MADESPRSGLIDYMSKASNYRNISTMGGTALYVGKRQTAVNSDIEALLGVKKKAKKIKNTMAANRGRNSQRKSNLMSPTPPLKNFNNQYKSIVANHHSAERFEDRKPLAMKSLDIDSIPMKLKAL